MELDELTARLVPFCQAMYEDPDARVSNVFVMPGHAGFAYGFTATANRSDESWFLRLPPPNVNWRGTADVLRQVQVLNALDGTPVPHCSVRWSGDDLQWFGCPYFIVPQLQGDVVRMGPGEWASVLPDETRRDMARQVMTALAEVHRLDWTTAAPALGPPIPFDEDVTRWDRFYERAADPELLVDAPEVRQRLLDQIPHDAPIGIFHGDFQTSNLFFDVHEARLLALIDWELVGVGATLNDVGWICTFSDNAAWPGGDGGAAPRPSFLDPDALVELYVQAWGEPLPDIGWYRALAAYKFAIITGLNLSLHRRGKRVDPSWEITRHAMPTLMSRALQLLATD
ncbi:MAG: phosphotransferase family protein [Proteobacteria bacterium]|jgi:aminoglycoside phosphotransferase (APT) family kinase protein|nr:phosphotransferase family protein [Pseudomonadota bacterium]